MWQTVSCPIRIGRRCWSSDSFRCSLLWLQSGTLSNQCMPETYMGYHLRMLFSIWRIWHWLVSTQRAKRMDAGIKCNWLIAVLWSNKKFPAQSWNSLSFFLLSHHRPLKSFRGLNKTMETTKAVVRRPSSWYDCNKQSLAIQFNIRFKKVGQVFVSQFLRSTIKPSNRILIFIFSPNRWGRTSSTRAQKWHVTREKTFGQNFHSA